MKFLKKFINLGSKTTADEVVVSGDESLVLSRDTGPAIRMAMMVIFIAFGGFILWAILAPLDEGATTTGSVVIDSRRRVIQHMNGGVVQALHVKEGDQVKEGQILVTLSQTSIRSQKSILSHQLQQLSLQIQQLKPMADDGYYPALNYQELIRQKSEVQDKLVVVNEELSRTEIKAPIAGGVMGLAITMGGVVSPSQKILEVVPQDESLVVEVKIMPQLIDRIHPGLEAQVRFSALNQRTTPVVHGKVMWVSADKFLAQDYATMQRMQGDGYYTAKVQLNSDELSKLGDQQLYPGMPADVIIKTGRRNFMSYLLKPFTDRAAMSLKER